MRRFAAILLVLASPLMALAADPALLVRLKSIDGFKQDAKYLARALGQEHSADQIDGLVDAWCGENGLAGTGLDLKRSVVLYAMATSGGIDSPFALVLPVTDEATVLTWLESMRIKANKGKDGLYSLDLPSAPAPVYFRFANKCMYLTGQDSSHIDANKLVAPEALPAADANQLLGVTLWLDRMPDDLKNMIMGQIEMRLAEQKNRDNPGDSSEKARTRRQGMDMLGVVIKTLMSEGKSVDFSWTIDRDKDDIAMSLLADGKPSTMMSTMIKMLGNGTTRFAPAQDSSLHVGVNLAIPDEIRMLINPFLEMGMKDQVAKERDPDKQAAVAKTIEAVWPTLKAGVIDMHLAVGSPSAGGNYNVLAALGVQGGEKIAATARELLDKIPASDRAQIKIDAAKVNDVSLHQLKIDNLDPEAKRLFGNGASAWAGFGKTAMMVGLGGEPAAAFAGLTSNDPPKPAPAIVIEGSLSKLASIDKNPASNKVATKVFGSTPGTDRFQLSLNGGQQLKLAASFKGRGLTFFQQLNEMK